MWPNHTVLQDPVSDMQRGNMHDMVIVRFHISLMGREINDLPLLALEINMD